MTTAHEQHAAAEQTTPPGPAEPKQYFITLPGLEPTYPISAELAEDEATLRDRLRPLFAWAGDAELRREERDGATYIHVLQRAVRKGCHDDCPHSQIAAE